VRCARFALAGVCLLLAFGTAAADAAPSEPIGISVSPAQVSTRLGDSFQFGIRVTNRGATELPGLIAHLNVVSLTRSVYVDPEDWSASRTKYLPSLGPGASARLSWKVKAVSGGEFAVYAVVLPGSPAAATEQPPAVSPAMEAHVTERRNLNPGGALPLALGVPGALVLFALALRVRRRAP